MHIEFNKIDSRCLSPAERTALRAEIIRRARFERDQVICSGIARAWRGFWRLLKSSALRWHGFRLPRSTASAWQWRSHVP